MNILASPSSAGYQRPSHLALAMVFSTALAGSVMAASPLIVDLGAASTFGVLAATAITVTGPTTIYGDAGTTSGTAITGTETLTLTGTNYGGTAPTQAAHASLVSAYNDAAGRVADVTYPAIYDLADEVLMAGVYANPSSFAIDGTLTLDGNGDPGSVWIFKMSETLTTGTDSVVSLINGAQASNVFWQVGSSATIGTGSDFSGNILAFTSITLVTGATVDGRLLAAGGAVTLDSNVAGIPEPDSFLLLASVFAVTCTLRRRRAVSLS